jgi:two-component system, OmpR family, sensor histidine kinase KdpD
MPAGMPDREYIAPERVTVVLRRSPVGLSVAASIAIVAIDTVVCRVALDHKAADVVMLYLLGVVVVAMRFGYLASLLATVLSVGAFDFFFTEPYLSFSVNDKRYVVTLAIMLFVAFVIANLMERIRRSAEQVRRRELRTARLYALSRELSSARSSDDIARVAHRHLRDFFGNDVAVLLPDSAGGVRRSGTAPENGESELPSPALSDLAVELIATVTKESERPATRLAPTGQHLVALSGSNAVFGVLVTPPLPDFFENPDNCELLDAFATQVALAFERAQIAEDAQRALFDVQKERLRNALLSSVSHDLRTPLAVVKGAVTALLDRNSELTASRRQEYLETISEEASRLNRLVRNLLDMTSLEAGALHARKEWQPLEEVVGVALNRMEEPLQNRPVRVAIAPDAALAPFDATLLEQVLVNLVENAVRYTPSGSPIDIRATREERGVQVEIADRGPGIAPGQEERIFEKFKRAAPPTTGGMGLGLTICRGIIAVHGGTIWCENRPGGGASFRFLLPRDANAPLLDGLPEAPGEP